MKDFFRTLKPSLIMLFYFTVTLGVIYPILIWGFGQVFFHKQANGSLIYREDGSVIGSVLIGQQFTQARYFHPRPSFAGKEGYDSLTSQGSDLGPTSQKQFDALKERATAYRQENGLMDDQSIPLDAIAASDSGLDPHISIENALIQAYRVAESRSLSIEEVHRLIEKHTEGRCLGFLGEKKVNVLLLNLDLDRFSAAEGKNP